ncbi:hypothetical protein D7003_07610 [Arthrobacter oryzae]|uniref:Uncharacterized protein n=1 Tax=Arthrobacter oryzae TaxID=409290 RepID=A0A3N0C3K6_9MICC|nr:hypothetical protein D7003_07610 [Arthrobacter oryzae]
MEGPCRQRYAGWSFQPDNRNPLHSAGSVFTVDAVTQTGSVEIRAAKVALEFVFVLVGVCGRGSWQQRGKFSRCGVKSPSVHVNALIAEPGINPIVTGSGRTQQKE